MAYSTCCCCCCCLHWIGAAGGGIYGVVAACKAEGKKYPPVHPVARTYVVEATWIGVAVVAFVLMLGGVLELGTTRSPLPDSVSTVLLALALLPSLVFVPVGGSALIGALLAKRAAAHITDQVQRAQMAAGMRLAWRIAWMSVVWSMFLSGISYLVMYIYVVLS